MNYQVAKPFASGTYKKITDCIIVKEAKDEDEKVIYQLLSALYPKKLILENHEWAEYLWRKDLNIWDTEELCKDIESKLNWSNLSLENIETNEWYNNFLTHVSNYDERFLKEHALLPNMNGLLLKRMLLISSKENMLLPL